MDSETTRKTALAYFQAIGQVDADAFAGLFSADAHFEDPVGTPVLIGREGVTKFYGRLKRAWASLKMSPQDVFVRGSEAAVRWAATGQSATGKDIAFGGINVFSVDDDGQITRAAGYWDMEDVIKQM